MRARGLRAAAFSAAAGLALVARVAHAQDFATGLPAGPDVSPSVTLEHGLPYGNGLALETSYTSWLGVPGLATRAVSGAFGLGAARVALGASRTGLDPLGWDAAGMALGAAGSGGGAAVRAVARREDDGASHPRGITGVEAGAGAWVRAGAIARVWAVAPQLWTRGSPPPLPRALTIGVAMESDGVSAWLERTGPARSFETTGSHDGGVAVDLELARVWLEARERPLRAALGVSAHARRFDVRVRVEAHPVLGETVTLAVATLARGAPANPPRVHP